MNFSRVLAFHTEKLHDDEVWRRVQQVASRLTENGITATFFVYPFRAQSANRDITARVRKLATLGHEIAQHTHFYAGTKIDKPEKTNDLSEENVIRCLRRDFETLKGMSFQPKGFTAGAWLVDETVRDALIELGFVYDCSAQFPKPKEMTQSPFHCWLRAPQLHSVTGGEVLCLPTTCSLGEWFKWGRKVRTEGKVPYQLIYLHDYDMLSFRTRLLLACFLKISTRQTLKPVGTIAKEYVFREEKYDVRGSCKQI